MRIAASIVLTLAATVAGLSGLLMLGLAGLYWEGGFVLREFSDSDDLERTVGVAMGIAGLAGWAGLSATAAFVGLRGRYPSRAGSVAVCASLAFNAAVLLGAMVFVLTSNHP
ncbi:MAG: hypothetical protein K0R60_366 [Microbacterium sp.]|uniref:hypothetical protein n=1 Tax=Microbacterium TaxID=33882 RepID=UPI000E71A636|nr:MULTISPECIES: hypothetical protein [Microbacterium]MDF2554471.1 hypothetical protein [Microbacterium sp.]RKE64737.1 hypothetical protein DEU36_1969 [Microbacterium sp. AG238]WJM15675.1 hypothetical protein QUC20_15605 [Microbacterium arborescens]